MGRDCAGAFTEKGFGGQKKRDDLQNTSGKGKGSYFKSPAARGGKKASSRRGKDARIMGMRPPPPQGSYRREPSWDFPKEKRASRRAVRLDTPKRVI